MSEEIKLSKTERLILANQYRILAKLEPVSAKYYEEIAEVFEHGYVLEYHRVFECVYEELDEAASREVMDTLQMYLCLKKAVDGFSENEWEGIDVRAVASFAGWDGNDDDGSRRLGYARFMRKTGRWSTIESPDNFNSHMPEFGRYKRMLRAWGESRDKYNLTAADVRRILWAYRHPDSKEGRRIAEEKKADA